MGQAIDISRLSGMKFPIHILASTFSTVSDELDSLGKTLMIKDLIRHSFIVWQHAVVEYNLELLHFEMAGKAIW